MGLKKENGPIEDNRKKYLRLNPLLFTRALACPISVQKCLSYVLCLHLDFLTTVFLYLVVKLAYLKKILGLVMALEIRPFSAFTAFRAFLLSANNPVK
jgi:hypothetical protein